MDITTPKKARRPTQADIARLVGVDQATVSRVLNRTPGYRVADKTQHKVFEVAQRLGYDLTRVVHARRRAHPRLSVNLPVSLAIRLKRPDTIYDRGTARLRDLSPAGGLLSHLELPKRSLPIDPFVVDMEITHGVLKGTKMSGEIIRCVSNGRLSLGMSYRRISPEDQERISAFIQIHQLAQRHHLKV